MQIQKICRTKWWLAWFLKIDNQNLKAQYYATASKGNKVQLWNESISFQYTPVVYGRDPFYGLAYDFERDYIYVGTDDGQMIVWNVKNNTQIKSFKEKSAVFCIAKVNSTLVVIAYDYFLVFISGYDLSNRTELREGAFGKIRALKVLENENKILIGAADKNSIFLYCLINLKILDQIDLASSIITIDAINRDFIVSECDKLYVCIHTITNTSTFNQVQKSLSLDTNILAIKIINEKSVFLGCLLYLGFWNVSNNKVIQLKSNYEVPFLEKLSSDKIGAINLQGNLDVWSISSLSFIETLKNDNNLVFAFIFIPSTFQSNIISNTIKPSTSTSTLGTSSSTTIPSTTSTTSSTTIPSTTSTTSSTSTTTVSQSITSSMTTSTTKPTQTTSTNINFFSDPTASSNNPITINPTSTSPTNLNTITTISNSLSTATTSSTSFITTTSSTIPITFSSSITNILKPNTTTTSFSQTSTTSSLTYSFIFSTTTSTTTLSTITTSSSSHTSSTPSSTTGTTSSSTNSITSSTTTSSTSTEGTLKNSSMATSTTLISSPEITDKTIFFTSNLNPTALTTSFPSSTFFPSKILTSTTSFDFSSLSQILNASMSSNPFFTDFINKT
ncbi:unnamed protein product [Brachionus calyciflorus]|uniref:Uncharacterized protein n=1 Tax=Brachionus calyciflorus TaxID=104777 RepID=A0A814EX37_9BILA|nr:unnamed protein product [Brachionus calyciflorus]